MPCGGILLALGRTAERAILAEAPQSGSRVAG